MLWATQQARDRRAEKEREAESDAQFKARSQAMGWEA